MNVCLCLLQLFNQNLKRADLAALALQSGQSCAIMGQTYGPTSNNLSEFTSGPPPTPPLLHPNLSPVAAHPKPPRSRFVSPY